MSDFERIHCDKLRNLELLADETGPLRKALIDLIGVASGTCGKYEEKAAARRALGGYCKRCHNDDFGRLITRCGRKDCMRPPADCLCAYSCDCECECHDY